MTLYKAEFTDEALEQIRALDRTNREKIIAAIQSFEQIGTAYKNLNTLNDGLYEIKPKGVRAYFKYAKDRIIIIGIVVLKKTEKAPKRYIEQALRNIDKYLKENKEIKI
jgi:phage-related protein